MTPEQRYRTEMLRTAMNAIFRNIRAEEPLFSVDESVTLSLCNEIGTFTFLADSDDDGIRAWNHAALATEGILRDRNDDTVETFIAVYGALPPMALPND